MRATVRIDRCQPAGVPVRTTSARSLANAGVEPRLDGGPLERRQVVEVGQIGYVHDRRRYAPSTTRVAIAANRLARPCPWLVTTRSAPRLPWPAATGRRRQVRARLRVVGEGRQLDTAKLDRTVSRSSRRRRQSPARRSGPGARPDASQPAAGSHRLRRPLALPERWWMPSRPRPRPEPAPPTGSAT